MPPAVSASPGLVAVPVVSLPNPKRLRDAARPLMLLVALTAGLLLVAGIRKVPSGPASGTGLHAVGRPQPSVAPLKAVSAPVEGNTTFRVGTFNVDGCRGLDDRVDVRRTAAQMRGCDLVALNEVHGGAVGERRDQAQRLGEELGMPWLFFPVERRWWRDDFGNGLLSTLPVTHWERWPLAPDGASSNRNVNLVTLAVDGRPVRVLITHLGRHDERTDELSQVLDLFQSLAAPAILVGDLNTPDTDPTLHAFLQSGQATDVLARLPEAQRQGRIDWILVRGIDCSAAGIAPKGVSDHPFYWADLRVAR